VKAGDLMIGDIAGNKNLDSYAGNITIAVGNPDDYASVDATLKAGDIQASIRRIEVRPDAAFHLVRPGQAYPPRGSWRGQSRSAALAFSSDPTVDS